MMQKDQVSGTIDRALAVLATIFLGKMVTAGYLGQSDAAALIPFIVLLPSLLWGWWVNRNAALVESARSVPGTVVITQPELAGANPATNVVSNTASPEKIAAEVEKAIVAELPKASKPV